MALGEWLFLLREQARERERDRKREWEKRQRERDTHREKEREKSKRESRPSSFQLIQCCHVYNTTKVLDEFGQDNSGLDWTPSHQRLTNKSLVSGLGKVTCFVQGKRPREREREDWTPLNSDNVVMNATLQKYQMNSDRVIVDSAKHQADILPTRVWSVALGKWLSSSSKESRPTGLDRNMSRMGRLST